MMPLLKQYKKMNAPLEVEYIFYAKDKRDFDLSNKIESINDILVDAGIIEDDAWRVLRKYRNAECLGVDKDKPQCEVTLWETNANHVE